MRVGDPIVVRVVDGLCEDTMHVPRLAKKGWRLAQALEGSAGLWPAKCGVHGLLYVFDGSWTDAFMNGKARFCADCRSGVVSVRPGDELVVRSARSEAWDRDEVCAAFQRFHREHGRPPLQGDIQGCPYLPWHGAVRRLFGNGGWQAVWDVHGWGRIPTGRGVAAWRRAHAERRAA